MNGLIRTLDRAAPWILGLWLGALAMTGVMAAIIFPEMREIDPVAQSAPAFDGDHAVLVAGRVMARVFFVNDVVRLTGAILVLTCALLCVRHRGTPARARTGAALLAVGSSAAYWIMLRPELARLLETYWSAAAAGDNALAEQSRRAFDELHPTASRWLGTEALLTLLAGVLWTLRRPTMTPDDSRDDHTNA